MIDAEESNATPEGPTLRPPSAVARQVPAGTATQFVLLIAAVLATTSIVYMMLYGAVPSQYRHFRDSVHVCEAREPAIALPPDGGNNIHWKADALNRVQKCMAPVYREEAVWGGAGVVLVFGLAAVLYWIRPWWLIRRGRLSPVQKESDLADDLTELSEQAGLTPEPEFFIGEDDTVNADAFGRIGRRCVRLNAALVDLRKKTDGTADPEGEGEFRAAVLHELAHLRNRDIDRTELAYAIGTSFMIVAMPPMVWLLLRPSVLSTVTSGGRLRIGLTLAALAAVVVLTRLAVLRIRELHADVEVVYGVRRRKPDSDQKVDSATTALAGDLGRLMKRVSSSAHSRRPFVLRTHPDNEERQGAIERPEAVLLRSRPWELFGTGMIAAVITTSAGFVLGAVMPERPLLSHAISGLITVPGLAGLLGVAVWRAVARTPEHRPRLRELALSAVALATGWLCGEPLALTSVHSTLDYRQMAVNGLILLGGGLGLAVWLSSAIRAVLTSPGGDRRWPPATVILGGVIAVAPWFAVWVMSHETDDLLFGWEWGDSPAPGGSIGWYAALAHWTVPVYPPLSLLYYSPLTLPALTLLWLVPVAVVRAGRLGPSSSRSSLTLRPALVAGLAGGLIYALGCVLLGYAAKVALPSQVRASNDLVWVALNSYVAIAALAQAAVAMVLAVVVRHHRAVVIPLATLLTGTLAAVAIDVAVMPASQCLDLFGNAHRLGASCLKPRMGLTFDAEIAHWVLVKGALAAVPGALLGAAIAAWRTHRRPPEPVAPNTDSEASQAHPMRTRVMVGLAVALLPLILLTASGLLGPKAYRTWLTTQESGTAKDPGTTGLATTVPCLVGTWTETRYTSLQRLDGAELWWRGKGRVQRFTAEGAAVLDFGPGNLETATFKGQRWERVTTGTIIFRYATRDGKIIFTEPEARGTRTLKVDGVVRSKRPLEQHLEPMAYTCQHGTMAQDSDSSRIDLRRNATATAPISTSSHDPCVIGTWVETSRAVYANVWWTSKGLVQRFRADGTGTLDYGQGLIETAQIDGPPKQVTTTGTITFRYQTQHGKIRYSGVSATGTVTGKVGGTVQFSRPRKVTALEPDTYSCEDDTMTQRGADYTIHLSRTNQTP